MSEKYETGMVVAPQPEAAEAGLEVLRAGGNAVDAALATRRVPTERSACHARNRAVTLL